MPKVIHVPKQEFFNNETQEFYYTKETTFKIEHSLVSIAKWESKWHVAFLDDKVEKTEEMIIDYIKCMTITQNVKPEVYTRLTNKNIDDINKYIEAPMTATTFSNISQNGGSREVVTSELIYYWMIALNVPMECQKWHLNRLLTLIKVCNEKNKPGKKMSKSELLSRNRSLNEMRKAVIYGE